MTIYYITDNLDGYPVMDYWFGNLRDARRFIDKLKKIYPDQNRGTLLVRMIRCKHHLNPAGLYSIEIGLDKANPNNNLVVCRYGGAPPVPGHVHVSLFADRGTWEEIKECVSWYKILRPFPG